MRTTLRTEIVFMWQEWEIKKKTRRAQHDAAQHQQQAEAPNSSQSYAFDRWLGRRRSVALSTPSRVTQLNRQQKLKKTRKQVRFINWIIYIVYDGLPLRASGRGGGGHITLHNISPAILGIKIRICICAMHPRAAVKRVSCKLSENKTKHHAALLSTTLAPWWRRRRHSH